MAFKSIEIHQSNMYCQHCFYNVVKAISQIDSIKYLDINMSDKTIKIKYQDKTLNNKSIRYFINKAIITGRINYKKLED